MDLIKQLTESNMLPSTTSYRKFTGKQIAEVTFMHILALRILSCEAFSKKAAAAYALKTLRNPRFDKWAQSGTDMYLLLHGILGDDIDLRSPDSSADYLHGLYIDEPKIKAWLTSIAHNSTDAPAHRLFVLLDNQFKIRDSGLRAIRRLVMDWPGLSLREKQLSMTRLLQFMRARARQSDLLGPLEGLAKHHRLEMKDVCDPESGEGCGDAGSPAQSHEPRKVSTLAKFAAAAAGGFLGWKVGKAISEDDGGAAPAAAPSVATTTADIAPLVKPLGKLRRRNK